MTWTKLPAEFYDDDLMLSVSRSARLLHVEALCWSNRQGTDGVIPAERLRRMTDEPNAEAAAAELVTAGAWTTHERGWQLVANLVDQPSAADVERTRALAQQRQRRQRQHRAGDHSLCDSRYCRAVSRVTEHVTSRVTDGVSHDTRTEPSRAGKAKARYTDGERPVWTRPATFPPHCGAANCNPDTSRLIGEDGSDVGVCPRCHPSAMAAVGREARPA